MHICKSCQLIKRKPSVVIDSYGSFRGFGALGAKRRKMTRAERQAAHAAAIAKRKAEHAAKQAAKEAKKHGKPAPTQAGDAARVAALKARLQKARVVNAQLKQKVAAKKVRMAAAARLKLTAKRPGIRGLGQGLTTGPAYDYGATQDPYAGWNPSQTGQPPRFTGSVFGPGYDVDPQMTLPNPIDPNTGLPYVPQAVPTTAVMSPPKGYEKHKAKGKLSTKDMLYELSVTIQQQILPLIQDLIQLENDNAAMLAYLMQPEGTGAPVDPNTGLPYGQDQVVSQSPGGLTPSVYGGEGGEIGPGPAPVPMTSQEEEQDDQNAEPYYGLRPSPALEQTAPAARRPSAPVADTTSDEEGIAYPPPVPSFDMGEEYLTGSGGAEELETPEETGSPSDFSGLLNFNDRLARFGA